MFERGYQYLSEVRLDSMTPVLEAMRDALAPLGLPPRSMEDEWGPGQVEFSFPPMRGLAAADAAVLFRSAVKQVCQRRGLLATFMCRPGLPNFFSSGWHLHQSLTSRADGAQRVRQPGRAAVARRAVQYVAGLLEHALPSLLFAAPTVNGYKRYRPYSFAPDRVCWAVENRGALVRVQGSAGDASSHVEMRIGRARRQPVPVHGGQHRRGPGRHRSGAGAAAAGRGRPVRGGGAVMLPTSLADAVGALDDDEFYREAFGDTLVDYLVHDEARRDRALRGGAVAAGPPTRRTEVSDWEMREYFEFF